MTTDYSFTMELLTLIQSLALCLQAGSQHLLIGGDQLSQYDHEAFIRVDKKNYIA